MGNSTYRTSFGTSKKSSVMNENLETGHRGSRYHIKLVFLLKVILFMQLKLKANFPLNRIQKKNNRPPKYIYLKYLFKLDKFIFFGN